MNYKRGQSNVVSAVLIILLVVAAIAIVGFLILGLVNNANVRVAVNGLCNELNVNPVQCVYPESYPDRPLVTVERDAGGSDVALSNISLIFNEKGGTEVRSTSNAPSTLATQIYDIYNISEFPEGPLSNPSPDSVQIEPSIVYTTGKTYPCNINPISVQCTMIPTYYVGGFLNNGNITAMNVQIPASTGFAISFWYNSPSFGSGITPLISLKSGASSLMQSYVANNLYLTGSTSTSSGSQTVIASIPSANKWHNIIVNYDGSNLNLYVDGMQSPTSNSLSGGISAQTVNIVMGSSAYRGYLDEVRVYDKSLSQNEIGAINATGRIASKTTASSGLIDYYTFDEGQGNALDLISGYDAQFNGPDRYPG